MTTKEKFDKSTYREQRLVLQNGINKIDFRDTKPNHFHIKNFGASDIFLGVTGIPSDTIHDKHIPSFGEGLFSRDLGVKSIQIFCNGTGDNTITLTTFVADFNPATLSNSVIVAGGGGGGTVAENVTIKGHSAPLPSGSNFIGHVAVDQMPNISFSLDTLPAGTNLIGSVDINKISPLAEGNSHIGKVSVANAVSISSMPPVTVSEEPIRQKHHVFDGEVSTIPISFDMTDGGLAQGQDVNFISYIQNDGNTDLFFCFDEEIPSATSATGLNKMVRLKAGESVSDLPRKCYKIHFVRAEGTGNVRFLGV